MGKILNITLLLLQNMSTQNILYNIILYHKLHHFSGEKSFIPPASLLLYSECFTNLAVYIGKDCGEEFHKISMKDVILSLSAVHVLKIRERQQYIADTPCDYPNS